MADPTIVGDSLTFGITHDEASLVTQAVSMTKKSDKKEARDKTGIVVAVAYYNFNDDISIEGLGTATNSIGAELTLQGTFNTAGGIFVDELTIDKANEEFVKSSIRATSYGGIAATP